MTQENKNLSPEFEFMYVLKGDPIPLARARLGTRAVYDSQKHLKLIQAIELSKQHGLQDLFQGPLQLDITFYMPFPYGSRRNKEKLRGTYHHKRPDLSNLIKFYEDIATKILYDDDCLISLLTAKKLYDDEPRTEFCIRKLRHG